MRGLQSWGPGVKGDAMGGGWSEGVVVRRTSVREPMVRGGEQQ